MQKSGFSGINACSMQAYSNRAEKLPTWTDPRNNPRLLIMQIALRFTYAFTKHLGEGTTIGR